MASTIPALIVLSQARNNTTLKHDESKHTKELYVCGTRKTEIEHIYKSNTRRKGGDNR
jgi:hypothetical protein